MALGPGKVDWGAGAGDGEMRDCQRKVPGGVKPSRQPQDSITHTSSRHEALWPGGARAKSVPIQLR